MRTLLLTDLHFYDTPRGLLEAQKKAIIKIISDENPEDIIIMGDLMMRRRPSPKVLLALRDVIACASSLRRLTIIRGNHDSETKADDGVTALSLFDKYARVVTHTLIDDEHKRAFIPHYENEQLIIKSLREVPPGYTVFGHFGYFGSVNSMGDSDFTINLDCFHNNSFLGHIHRFHQKEVGENKLTVLGTPYTTNFTEEEKGNYYAILSDEDKKVEFKEIFHGPKHIVVNYNDLEEKSSLLDDPNYFKIVRVVVDKLTDSDNQHIAREVLSQYDVDCLEIKYKPVFEEEEENYYSPEKNPFTIDDDILREYVMNTTAALEKDDIFLGLDLINNAYKKNQN